MDKSINKIAANTHEALQTQKALTALASQQGSGLPSILSKLDAPHDSMAASVAEAQDVTEEFLAPLETHANELPDTDIIVYAGILKRLTGMTPVQNQVVFLSGVDSFVSDAVVADDVATAMESPVLLNHLKNRGCQILGLAVFENVVDPSTYEATFQKLPTSNTRLLLLSVCGFELRAWIASANGDHADGHQFVWSAVEMGNKGSRRKQGRISFVHINRIGVSMDDEVQVQNGLLYCTVHETGCTLCIVQRSNLFFVLNVFN